MRGGMAPLGLTRRYARSAPYTPNTAPEAPAETVLGCHARLASEPPTALSRYSTVKAHDPKKRSTNRPVAHKHHILTARCSRPTCTNAQVTSRHHSPAPAVRGPKLAPHL